MSPQVAADLIKMLQADNARLRAAGSELAAAAIYTAKEYDGVHRLMLAASGWCKAVADEGGRGGGAVSPDRCKCGERLIQDCAPYTGACLLSVPEWQGGATGSEAA